MKKRGITLVELLIVLGIMGIIAAAVSSFFFSNYKVINNVSTELDFQREGEKALSIFVEETMGTKGIENIDVYTSDGKSCFNSITFTSLEGTDIVFTVEDNKLFLKKGSEAKRTAAEYINKIQIGYITSDGDAANTDYSNVSGISITVYLQGKSGSGNDIKKIEGQVYFRNKN